MGEQSLLSKARQALPNIGTSVARELLDAGISTAEGLKRLGAVDTALQLIASGHEVCASKLYALEGAIRGIRWHDIPLEERRALWNVFRAASGKG
ncbi:TfoX/Sxy family protein [Candidatus Bipolaricaulota bacterium]|nr:TfoX/Sxy family protein [Candidatus Bipolaricaulota bacterium]